MASSSMVEPSACAPRQDAFEEVAESSLVVREALAACDPRRGADNVGDAMSVAFDPTALAPGTDDALYHLRIEGFPADHFPVDTWRGREAMSEPAARARWRADFLSAASDYWSRNNLWLWCQRDWWEHLAVRPTFVFVEDAADPYYSVLVKKIPAGAQLQSLTLPPDLHQANEPGPVDLDSEGLRARPNESKNAQRSAIHETGHMLGLGDEYEGIMKIAHADLVQKNLGLSVPIKDDDRIMSRGERAGVEHGVTVLEALNWPRR